MAVFRSRTQPTSASHSVGTPAVAQALSEWQQRVEQARREGREQGLKEAQARIATAEARAAAAEQAAKAAEARAAAAAEQRLGGAIASLAAAASGIEGLQRQLAESAEAEAVALGLAVARRILEREIEAGGDWVRPLLSSALARVPDKRRVQVRMHPADAEAAGAVQRALIEANPGVEALVIDADPDCARGTCVLVSQGTRLDASIACSWERLGAELLAAAPAPALAEPVDGNPGGAP